MIISPISIGHYFPVQIKGVNYERYLYIDLAGELMLVVSIYNTTRANELTFH